MFARYLVCLFVRQCDLAFSDLCVLCKRQFKFVQHAGELIETQKDCVTLVKLVSQFRIGDKAAPPAANFSLSFIFTIDFSSVQFI